ncbi:hypothetical protein [Achromobacter insuavis]|uniref:hypothetical protein n=1 Tax=Achromobacter insuavis TaxID=1287735 RepID=UPI001F13C011|nr:hypothetical protein [Achromobacter insuavis]
MTTSQNLRSAYDLMAGTLGSYAPAGDLPHLCAYPGAETPCATTETRTNAGFDPAAAAGRGPALNVNLLALDLGRKLGWAVRSRDGRISHGTQVFTPRASWSPGQRWLRARSFLVELITQRQVHAIAYEDVKRHAGTDAAHAYGAFLCIVEMLADSHRLRLLPVGASTIKKQWTGHGMADKDAMVATGARPRLAARNRQRRRRPGDPALGSGTGGKKCV